MPGSTEERHADHRFVLANERTYLACMRTALATLAAGALTSAAGFWGWRQNDRQIHDDKPLHKTWAPLFLRIAVTGLGVVVVLAPA